jgi:hypothetical protein
MGLFKTKQEKEQERKMLVKQSMKELEKRIRKLKEQEAVYIKQPLLLRRRTSPSRFSLQRTRLR